LNGQRCNYRTMPAGIQAVPNEALTQYKGQAAPSLGG